MIIGELYVTTSIVATLANLPSATHVSVVNYPSGNRNRPCDWRSRLDLVVDGFGNGRRGLRQLYPGLWERVGDSPFGGLDVGVFLSFGKRDSPFILGYGNRIGTGIYVQKRLGGCHCLDNTNRGVLDYRPARMAVMSSRGGMDRRTALGRVRGLGSAKEGVHHWWAQRITAIALVPLSIWFIAGLIKVANGGYAAAVQWLARPMSTIMATLLLVALFHHTQLGLQVVIEDYVHHEGAKIALIVMVKLVSFVLATAGVFAVLHLAFVS